MKQVDNKWIFWNMSRKQQSDLPALKTGTMAGSIVFLPQFSTSGKPLKIIPMTVGNQQQDSACTRLKKEDFTQGVASDNYVLIETKECETKLEEGKTIVCSLYKKSHAQLHLPAHRMGPRVCTLHHTFS